MVQQIHCSGIRYPGARHRTGSAPVDVERMHSDMDCGAFAPLDNEARDRWHDAMFVDMLLVAEEQLPGAAGAESFLFVYLARSSTMPRATTFLN
jgi:hypothetical protein